MTNNQNLVTWTDNPNPYGTPVGYGPITHNSSNPPWRDTHNSAEEGNAHNYRNLLAEERVFWREQGRNALNFQQAGFERAAEGI